MTLPVAAVAPVGNTSRTWLTSTASRLVGADVAGSVIVMEVTGTAEAFSTLATALTPDCWPSTAKPFVVKLPLASGKNCLEPPICAVPGWMVNAAHLSAPLTVPSTVSTADGDAQLFWVSARSGSSGSPVERTVSRSISPIGTVPPVALSGRLVPFESLNTNAIPVTSAGSTPSGSETPGPDTGAPETNWASEHGAGSRQ